MGNRPRVVIIGAGFGGLWAARTLAKSSADMVVVDCNNYHTFLPLLYQVAAAELAPEEIAYPVRGILRKMSNARFVLARAQKVDLVRKVVETDGPTLPYDFLIVATGSVPHYFRVPGAAEYAYKLKTLDQAVALRNHILRCFERAHNEPDAQKRQQALTFAIAGGGAMGVEFAGALAELVRGPLRRDYPALDMRQVRIILLESTDHLLPDLDTPLQTYATGRLERMGVQVRLGATVVRITSDAVQLASGEAIPTETVIWTAGVRGESLPQLSGLPVTRQGRVSVLPTLQVPDYFEVYVVGDLAYFVEGQQVLPMVAPVAIQQGVAAARNIIRQMRGQEAQPFHYRDMGRMATIGRNAAVASLMGREFTGLIAWSLWLVVHLVNLIGFRNRSIVIINWAWDYILTERGIRLIMPSETSPGVDAHPKP